MQLEGSADGVRMVTTKGLANLRLQKTSNGAELQALIPWMRRYVQVGHGDRDVDCR